MLMSLANDAIIQDQLSAPLLPYLILSQFNFQVATGPEASRRAYLA